MQKGFNSTERIFCKFSELPENERALIDEYFNLFDANHDGKIVYSEMEKTIKDYSDGENVEEKFTAFLNKYDVSYKNNYVSKRMVTDYFAEAKSDEVQIETVLTNLIQNITLVNQPEFFFISCKNF